MLFKQEGDWTLVEFKTDYVASQAKFEVLLAAEDYLAPVQRYAEATAACQLHSLIFSLHLSD